MQNLSFFLIEHAAKRIQDRSVFSLTWWSIVCDLRLLYDLRNNNKNKSSTICHTMHTVSFDWFLSGLEWILNFEFCLLKLLIFYQKLLWNIRSRLNSSTFWICLIKIFIFCAQSFNFDQAYLNTGLKTQNLEELSLDLISHNIFW